jgi:hypothetical protein
MVAAPFILIGFCALHVNNACGFFSAILYKYKQSRNTYMVPFHDIGWYGTSQQYINEGMVVQCTHAYFIWYGNDIGKSCIL